jgi:hypothetical protein
MNAVIKFQPDKLSELVRIPLIISYAMLVIIKSALGYGITIYVGLLHVTFSDYCKCGMMDRNKKMSG